MAQSASETQGRTKERQDVTEIIGNVVLVKSGFHTRKNFSENYKQFGNICKFINRLYINKTSFLISGMIPVFMVCRGIARIFNKPSL
jgi:hypothetical protein